MRYAIERLDQQLETLIGSPLSKRQNAMRGISPAGKVGRIRLPGKDSMRAHADLATLIFFIQSAPIGGHEHRKRSSRSGADA